MAATIRLARFHKARMEMVRKVKERELREGASAPEGSSNTSSSTGLSLIVRIVDFICPLNANSDISQLAAFFAMSLKYKSILVHSHPPSRITNFKN